MAVSDKLSTDITELGNWQSQVYVGNKLSVVAHVVNDDDYCNDLNGARLQWWIEKGNEKFCQEVSNCRLFLTMGHIGVLFQLIFLRIGLREIMY